MARKPMGERLPDAPAERELEATEDAGAAGRMLPDEPQPDPGPGLVVATTAVRPPAGRERSPLLEAWSAAPRSLRITLVVCLLPVTVYVLALRVGLSMPHQPVAQATPALAAPARPATPGPAQASPDAPAPAATPVQVAAVPAPAATPVAAPLAATAGGTASTPLPAPSPSGTAQPPSPAPTAVPQSGGQVASCGAPANPWGYTFCGGSLIHTAPRGFCSVFLCVAHFQEQRRADYVAECNDGAYAQFTHGDASCLSHGGEMRPLYQPTGSVGLLAQGAGAIGQTIR